MDILTLGTEIKTAYEGEPDTNSLTDALASKLGDSRETLAADRDYYVRADGNDSNDGLSDSPSGAFFTIRKAAETIRELDLRNFQVIVHVGPGTFPANVDLPIYVGSKAPLIIGDVTTPSNVVLGSPGLPIVVSIAGGAKPWRMEGFKLTGDIGMAATDYGYLRFSDMDFGDCALYHMQSTNNANISAYGPYTISGSAAVHVFCLYKSNISTPSRTVDLIGTPNFSSGYAVCRVGSVINVQNMTFNGAATGPRYEVTTNSVVYVAGAGPTYLPGNSSGSISDGGVYA